MSRHLPWVLGTDPTKPPQRQKPQPRVTDSSVPLAFNELRCYFQCPYQFELRFLYGFDSPVNRAFVQVTGQLIETRRYKRLLANFGVHSSFPDTP